MSRFEGNPILAPVPEHPWESKYVFNPAMFELGGKTHFLYRAMGEDMVSRLGYAWADEKFNVKERLSHPVFEPKTPQEVRGCEDPRVTVIDEYCYMAYTAFSWTPQIGLTRIHSNDLLSMRWNWGERTYPFPEVTNKNAVIYPRKVSGRYVMLHRIDPNMCIAYSDDLVTWENHNVFATPREGRWDCVKIGAAGPPLELDEGWLQLYHGVDQNRFYRLGAMLLDKDDPKKILYRSEDHFIEPCEYYECNGFVPNVIFSCGAVMRGNQVYVAYGASDTCIAVSRFSLNEILS
jgi:predicted GH43/DUF377 family glycosyl hydrolase